MYSKDDDPANSNGQKEPGTILSINPKIIFSS